MHVTALAVVRSQKDLSMSTSTLYVPERGEDFSEYISNINSEQF